MKKSILFASLISILLLAGCLPSTEVNTGKVSTEQNQNKQEEVKKPVIYKLNDVVEVDGQKIALTEVKDYVSSNDFMKAKDGHTYLAIMVEIENVSSDSTSYNMLNFKLVDKDGASYDTAFTDVDPSLNSGTLQPTRKAKGYVAYEVPADMANNQFEFIYEPLSFVDTTQVIWELE